MPRQTLKELLASNRKKPIIWLALITGLLNGIASIFLVWGKYTGQSTFQHFSVIVSNLVLGMIVALVYLYFMSLVYKWIGSWIDGKGSYQELYFAVGWSFYPWSVTALFGILNMIFTQDPQVQAIISLVYAILSIWALVIFLKLMGEAHHFSAWRALLTIAITLAIILAIVLIVGLIITLVRAIHK